MKESLMIEDKSLDVFAAKLAQLRELFPEVLTEGKIDFKRLRDVLGDEVSFNKEHYELSWAGKSDARAQIQKATSATLIPDDSGIAADGCGNIFIEGENLEVLHVLQRSYFGKIKMIYIDPPYNTGNDSFVYPDDYSERQDEYKKRAGITDKDGFLNKVDLWKKNSKESGQFHSVWLSMMYPRLYLARNLLREDGVIFISIDDNEQANLKLLCDEIFGAENFVADIIWEKRFTRNNDAKLMSSVVEHILLFRKSEKVSNLREPRTEKNNSIYINHDNDSRGAWTSVSYISQRTKEQRPNLSYEITNPITGEKVNHEVNAWKYSFDKYQEHLKENRLHWGKDGKNTYPRLKRFLSELETGVVPINFWSHKETGTTDDGTKEVNGLIGKDVFDYPKPISLLIRMMGLVFDETDNNGIILDFFSGSGTTAHAVLDLNEKDGGNRQFICVQLPEHLEENSEAYKAGYKTIADICKARITKVIAKIQAERDNKIRHC
jgi:adenine-specific DNA-methyltransferase